MKLSRLDRLVAHFKSNPDQARAFLDGLTEDEMFSLVFDLENTGRPEQQLPPGDWSTLLVKCGRGWGKTWFGAKVVNYWAKYFPQERIALVGDDIGEVRDVMIGGDSGIIAQADPRFVPELNKKEMILTWPNGAIAQGYSAAKPEELRGPNNGKAWVDELFKYRLQREVWDQLQFTMRKGDNPQVVVTSTPRTTQLLRELRADPLTLEVGGKQTDNYTLSRKYLDKMQRDYGGSRLGRQELDGDVLEDNPDALFKSELIDAGRHKFKTVEGAEDSIERQVYELLKTMDKVCVAVDPSVSDNDNSDETGIIVAGRRGDDAYIFEDASLKGSPTKWAQAVASAHAKFQCNWCVYEKNQGGLLVEQTIRNVDASIKCEGVTATRGKAIRAEPVSTLYEQGRVHHVGVFTDLETQMTQFNPSLGRNQKSPDRMDALVWALTKLFDINNRGPQLIFL